MKVIVYTTDNCPKCKMTLRRFGEFGVNPKIIQDSVSTRSILAGMGYQSYPVVQVYEGTKMIDNWCDNRPDKIAELFDKEKR